MKLQRKEIFRLAGMLGAVLLASGYIRYTLEEELLLASKILMIAGGVLILAWLVLDFSTILAFFGKRSAKLGTNSTVLILAVVAILVFVNYLGFHHHKTFDLTSEKLYTLSDQTKKIVGPLKQDVDIYCFAKSSDQELPALRNLMTEYENLNSHIHFRVVDPQENPGLAKQYGVARMGQVIVVSGPRTERLEETTEQDFTSAILKATSTVVKTVCFIEGHGEGSLADDSGKGFSAVDGELKKENYDVKSVNLVTSNGVPSDCSVAVDAGPTQAFFPQEAQLLEKYLDGGGKVLLLVDPGTDPKLDAVFKSWNITVGNDYVIDASGVGRLLGAGPAIPLVLDYGTSPITRDFSHTMTFFPLARTVSITDKSKVDPESVELLKTADASFTVPKLEKEVKYDPTTDQRGPLSLGVTAEKKSGKIDARLVVIGNSAFASNAWVGQQRNGDLFFNTINWLSEESNLISIRPKTPTNRRVTLTDAQQRLLSWFSMILLPLLVVIGGIYVWIKRR